jgi:preprotein translocase SecE subunit
MRQKNTLVGLFFIGVALLATWVFHLAFKALFVAIEVQNRPILSDRFPLSMLVGLLLAVGAAVGCYMHPFTNKRVNEVAEELNKVNWPSWAETKVNTIVVIVTSVIAAMILGVFDITFAKLSDWLAGVTF